MVKLRLKRMGNKFNPFYRIVAADARAPRDGRFIEEVGYYNPLSDDLKLNKELIIKWLDDGAQPTETVKNLLKQEKVWSEYTDEKNKAKISKPKKRKLSSKKIANKTTKISSPAKAKKTPAKKTIKKEK